MASESLQSASSPPVSVSPSSSSPPAVGNNAGESYIGSFISLISKYEIRYEGVLYHFDVNDSTLGLKNVRSCGTEGRKKDGLQAPPSDKVYDYILFRGSDIKDLEVKPHPSAQSKQEIQSDIEITQPPHSQPAMISPLSSSNGGFSLATQHMPATLSFPPSSSADATLIGQSSNLQSTQTKFPFSMPVPSFVQGNKTLAAAGPTPDGRLSTIHNQPHMADLDSSPITGLVGASDLPSNPPIRSIPGSFPGAYSQSLPYEMVGPVNHSPSFASPHLFSGGSQVLQSREHVFNHGQIASGGGDTVVATRPMSINQTPLLPLPVSVPQPQNQSSSIQFTEEFDFEAMNEKFRKDEVWGLLGKNKQRGQIDVREEAASEVNSEGKAKPAYNKDDFFDTISRNRLNRVQRGGHSHFPMRMRQDHETFGGEAQVELQPGDGGYLAAQGNYGGGYNSGVGYSSGYHYHHHHHHHGGERGRGRFTHF